MTASVSTVFEQLATLFGNEAFQAINPVIVSTLADIEANPQAWLNPLSAPIKGAAAVAALTAALPNLEGTAVTSAATLVAAIWTNLGAKLTTPATPAQVASTITNS